MKGTPLDRWELAARLAAIPSFAVAVVLDAADVVAVADELGADLRALLGGVVDVREAATADAIESVFTSRSPDWMVLHGLEAIADTGWEALDLARSRLERRDRVVVLVMRESTMQQLARCAPNLGSWLATETHRVVSHDVLERADADARLAVLRARYEISDAEAERRVEAGEAVDPEYAEWMVLLGKTDVLTKRARRA